MIQPAPLGRLFCRSFFAVLPPFSPPSGPVIGSFKGRNHRSTSLEMIAHRTGETLLNPGELVTSNLDFAATCSMVLSNFQ